MSCFRVLTLWLAILFVLSSMISSSVSYAATLVTAEVASRLLMNPTRSSPAVVVSLNQGHIPAQTSGVISEMRAKVGDTFNQGEILARVDCIDNNAKLTIEHAQFSQAKTQLLLNKRELVRGEELVKAKNIGEAELDRLLSAVTTAESLLKVQQALLDMAKLNVERCSIKAPFDGVVTQRIASVGEMISYGKPVIEMVEVNDLEVSAKIANSDESSFNGASAYLFDVGSAQYQVALRTILPVIQSNEKSREARFVFTDKKAIPGSTGRLRWQSEMSYLPAHLLLKRDGKRGYFIVEQLGDKNSAKFIAVSSAEEGRPLAFNMTPNTRIITEGRHGLNHGDEIEVTKQIKISHGDKS